MEDANQALLVNLLDLTPYLPKELYDTNWHPPPHCAKSKGATLLIPPSSRCNGNHTLDRLEIALKSL